jgi:hypothetical protein
MVLQLFKRLFAPPPVVRKTAELRPGSACLEGVLVAGPDQVRSITKNVPCVAFYYHAFYKAQARGKWVERVLKDVDVYSQEFSLKLEDGVVPVTPPKGGTVDMDEHRSYQGGRFPGFEVKEQLLRAGARVRLHGRVVREDGGFRLRLDKIELLPEVDEGPQPYRRPPKRRRKK